MSHPLDKVDPQDAPESSGTVTGDVIRCDACPVLCRIRKGNPARATATPISTASS